MDTSRVIKARKAVVRIAVVNCGAETNQALFPDTIWADCHIVVIVADVSGCKNFQSIG